MNWVLSYICICWFWMVQWLTAMIQSSHMILNHQFPVWRAYWNPGISCLETRIWWIVRSLPVSPHCFSFQNMVISRPFTYLLILTAHSLFTWLQSVEAFPPSPPEPTPADYSAPLSDEFINYINSLQTTWKVIFQEGCFVLRFVCWDLKVPVIQNTSTFALVWWTV